MKDPALKVAEALISELSDRGQIVEGGWKAYELLVLKDTSELQRSECRKAFFFGAQHLLGSMLGFMDPGEEPTESDMERMKKLEAELSRFVKEMQA
jgi:hypothetical protein